MRMKMRKKMTRTMMSLLCAFLMLFVTACAPSKPKDTVVTTTLDDSNNITTHPSTSIETTVPQTQETTQSDKTTNPTTTFQNTTYPTTSNPHPRKHRVFTSLDEYCDFAKTIDEQELRSLFTIKNYDESEYFDEKLFEIILKDRQYLLPVIPKGYMFKSIELSTNNPMVIAFERDEKGYGVFCYMSKEEKMPYTEENECFLKSDGTKVTADYFPAVNGGGTCYWEESGYQCFAWFTNENKEEMWNLIKEFELKIMPIE